VSTRKDKKMSLNAAYIFGREQGLAVEIDKIRAMKIEWNRSYTTTVRRGFIVTLFEEKGLFDLFKERYWPEGSTEWGNRQRRFYLKIKGEYDDFITSRSPGEVTFFNDDSDEDDDVGNVEADVEEEGQYFAAEADLRDFLAKNMHVVESGLQLFLQNGVRGVEYSVENGRIDILGVDRQGTFVVIELKLSRARSRALGQLLYYMGWVDTHLGHQPCRGIYN
jgi:hypothetical protein